MVSTEGFTNEQIQAAEAIRAAIKQLPVDQVAPTIIEALPDPLGTPDRRRAILVALVRDSAESVVRLIEWLNRPTSKEGP